MGGRSRPIDPKSFYKGHCIDWTPIIMELDVKRSISEEIILEVILRDEKDIKDKVEFYVLKGHAGSGKSIVLKRIAWDAATIFDKLCISINSESFPQYESLAELYRIYGERIFLFIDPVREKLEVIETFISRARKDKIPLTIIGAERHNEWNSFSEIISDYLTDSFDLAYLSDKEIDQLISLLTKHKSLGHMDDLTYEERKDALSNKLGRHLLVALHEATLGKRFEDIVLNEYKSITSPSAQSLYLTVCIMHRYGIPTRAGLISRVHGIPFSQFRDKLFKLLEDIVFAEPNKRIKDYMYCSRHPLIAEMVFSLVLIDDQDKYDEYANIINHIDVDYGSDAEAFRELMNHKKLFDLFNDKSYARNIYNLANLRVRDNPHLLQQEALFLMKCEDYDTAEGKLKKAIELAPKNKAIAHSQSVLLLHKARDSNNILQKKKYWEEAREASRKIILQGAITSHPYHTLLEVSIDELSELLKEADELSVQRKISEIEKLLSDITQLFPTSEFILDSQSKFNELLQNHPIALNTLIKAFGFNKSSPYLASRLANYYEFLGKNKEALDVLKKCIEAIPNDKYINYKYALALKKSPESKVSDIKYHLSKSYTEGDSNYDARFWYAVVLYGEGNIDDAHEIFFKLSQANVSTLVKQKPRGILETNSIPLIFTGTIKSFHYSHLFIIRDGLQDKIFTHSSYNEESWDQLKQAQRVKFNLAFNYRGAVALNVVPESFH